jgi:hypothetical protein
LGFFPLREDNLPCQPCSNRSPFRSRILKYGQAKYGGTEQKIVTYDKEVKVGDIITSETEYLGDITGRVIKQTFSLAGGIIVKDTVIK